MSGEYCASHSSTRSLCQELYCASHSSTRSLGQRYTAQVKVALGHYVRGILRKS